ncbi:GFA family protein [Prosthecomicrobium pneumaticum]|uniref:CENP-V/GFA domain-containing protein n=1 Tax=Prosthecomicrobium pneumaticum TaxID=81895 RepID=A0A7W9FMT2_9HYPH|nr:GFA family protein [Prosthecomicrobium pneumaticum]MBB5753559.1 hypothetical protein [Prosthecomicrobium pneumaticum]
MTAPVLTGGCQCGAVRFRVTGALPPPSICHCRMCQKQFGAFYGPFVNVTMAELVWTRGARKRFQSSNIGHRGFCGDCGTPLTYEVPGEIALAIGAFDTPAVLKPAIQFAVEAKLPFVDALGGLPARTGAEDEALHPVLRTIVSYQHPDHDTAAWPDERPASVSDSRTEDPRKGRM